MVLAEIDHWLVDILVDQVSELGKTERNEEEEDAAMGQVRK